MSASRRALKRARDRCEAAIAGSVDDTYTTWQGINDLKGNSDIARLNYLSNKNKFTIQILPRQKRKAFWVEMWFEGGFNVKDIPRFNSIDEPSESHVAAKNACARIALSWFRVGLQYYISSFFDQSLRFRRVSGYGGVQQRS